MITTISNLRSRLTRAPVIPILTVRDVDQTLVLIETLVPSGISVVEILFRTDHAGEAMRRAKQQFPDCAFAAGTIMDARSLASAIDAGADLLISPGLTAGLHELVKPSGLPLIPGVQTPSEVMFARQLGYSLLKYFPAEATNGLEVLRGYREVFSGTAFIPTGKITSEVLAPYAELGNVAALGGSWMVACKDTARLSSELEMLRGVMKRTVSADD